jgi:hypothetical protein
MSRNENGVAEKTGREPIVFGTHVALLSMGILSAADIERLRPVKWLAGERIDQPRRSWRSAERSGRRATDHRFNANCCF